jgi:RNA polymerase sigma-70 factor (ECF subfamily)
MHTKMEVTLLKRRDRTDADLLRAAATDARAFRDLYDRYAERIHGYHLRRTRDREAALDLAAATFAQAWLSRGRFRDEAGGSAGPWLFAIARHVVLASVERGRIERRAMTRLGVLEALDRPAPAAEPDPSWLEGLDDALADLPDGQRAAVELRIVDAADRLVSNDEVAASMPAGTLALAGTEPACTVVKQDVEYHCVLTRPPAPEVGDWKGTVEPTVDATKHVNGGCRSLRSDGLEWQCYIGEEAVAQQIVGESFLGEYAPSPGVG